MSLIHEIAACGDAERLEDVIKHKCDVNEVDEDWEGRSPLFCSVISGHVVCTRLLLEKGANPNIRNNDSKTVAHYAAEQGSYQLLKLVIEYGCDVTTEDKYGDTALDYALLYGNHECEELIARSLRGEVTLKIDPKEWLANENPNISKELRHDNRRRQSLMTLLSSLKVTEDDEKSDKFEGQTTKRKRKLSGRLTPRK